MFLNFEELKTGVEEWAVRSDFPTTVYGLATADINRGLRVREMLTTYSATTSTETLALPSDFLEFDHVYVDQDPRVPLNNSGGYDQGAAYRPSGIPSSYYVTGDNLHFNPSPDASYTLGGEYFASLAVFSANSDTNDVLTKYPEIYLYAAMKHVHAWAKDTEGEGEYLGKFARAVEDANKADIAARFSGQLKMRPRAYA